MLFVVDTFGRRTPLMIGAVGCTVTTFYLGAYTKVSNCFNETPPKDSGANAAIASIYIYAVFYAFSWNGIPWIFASEILPTHVRGFGMMCAGCMQWLGQFIIVYSLPYMINGIQYGMFLFFGACAVVAFVFAWLFVPETKGVALEDMELLFGEQTPVFASQKGKAFVLAKESGVVGGQSYWSKKGKGMEEEEGGEERIESV